MLRKISRLLFLVIVVAGLGVYRYDEFANASPQETRAFSLSSLNRRVIDVISSYEDLQKSVEERQKDVVLTFAEAASKLHLMTYGLLLETKCSKYWRLINKLDVRTVATISELMAEERSFSETIQEDADLLSKIANAIQFNTLGRISDFLRTLESEKTSGKSHLKPAVQKDLLDCTNYYFHRYQHEIADLVPYARTVEESLSGALSSNSNEVLPESIRNIMDRMVQMEEDNKSNHRDWLENLSQLQHWFVKENYEAPDILLGFLSKPDRMDRLHSIVEAGYDCQNLMDSITRMEKEALPKDSTSYRSELEKLRSIWTKFRDVLDDKVNDFLQHRQ